MKAGTEDISDQLVQRLAERRASVRRLRIRMVLAITAALVLLGGGAYVLLFSPVLALRAEEITVRGGGDLVDADEVAELALGHVDEPLARLDTSALAQEVGELIGVLEAQVSRDWPHGLAIVITPREPVAGVETDEGYLVLDAEAVELDRTDEPPDHLPVVDVPLDTDASAAALQAVVTVLGDLPAELFDQVDSASASSEDQVELILDDGVLVVWGSAEENELKASVLQTLLQVPAAVYDVSAPRNPITRES